ncbi:hypothetical protein HKW72_01170 [Pseudomonas aeruginosa]|nr:hypothetical protein [Pseudomonas aeruginosa]
MSIDWSKAPKGATHWEPSGTVFGEGWMKKAGNEWSYWLEGSEVWAGVWADCFVSAEREATFEARPQEAWEGQGLPPVGTLCEWHADGWVYTESNVVAYTDDGLFICMQKPGFWPVVQRLDNCEFRPLRTPEQIAAEEREKAIEEMCFAEETLTVKQAKALYEAGYRRQEEGK